MRKGNIISKEAACTFKTEQCIPYWVHRSSGLDSQVLRSDIRLKLPWPPEIKGIRSRGQPARGDPPSCGLDVGLTTHRMKPACYEMLRSALDLITWKIYK
jgi:hypothetical protein